MLEPGGVSVPGSCIRAASSWVVAERHRRRLGSNSWSGQPMDQARTGRRHGGVAGMPGGTDATGQAATTRHSTQERRRATHWNLGAYTSVGQVGCGEGCEPLLQHLVVHDDDSSPWVVAGLMMDW